MTNGGRIAIGELPISLRENPILAARILAFTVRDQHHGRQHVDDERDKGKATHEQGLWLMFDKDPVGGRTYYPEAEQGQKDTLKQGRLGASRKAPAHGDQPKKKSDIANEVEGVGL